MTPSRRRKEERGARSGRSREIGGILGLSSSEEGNDDSHSWREGGEGRGERKGGFRLAPDKDPKDPCSRLKPSVSSMAAGRGQKLRGEERKLPIDQLRIRKSLSQCQNIFSVFG